MTIQLHFNSALLYLPVPVCAFASTIVWCRTIWIMAYRKIKGRGDWLCIVASVVMGACGMTLHFLGLQVQISGSEAGLESVKWDGMTFMFVTIGTLIVAYQLLLILLRIFRRIRGPRYHGWEPPKAPVNPK